MTDTIIYMLLLFVILAPYILIGIGIIIIVFAIVNYFIERKKRGK
jgi:hypothetical protein